jgi:hypothetical protein
LIQEGVECVGDLDAESLFNEDAPKDLRDLSGLMPVPAAPDD